MDCIVYVNLAEIRKEVNDNGKILRKMWYVVCYVMIYHNFKKFRWKDTDYLNRMDAVQRKGGFFKWDTV